jgi:hypothetical protein
MDGSYGGLQRDPCADDSDGAAGTYPLAGGSVPPTPGGLTATMTTSVLVDWNDVSGEMGFEVWRATGACAGVSDGDFALVDTTAATVYVDDEYGGGLDTGENYCYKVRAFNTSGESAFSATAETGSSTPTPTASPTPSPSATPTPTPEPTETPTPTPTDVPHSTRTPSPSPEPSPSKTPSLAPTVTPSPPPSGAPTPADTPATPSPAPTEQPTPTPLAPGDVTCNGGVDAIDALHVLRVAAGLGTSAQCAEQGDVDCDGDLDVLDALAILRHVAGLPGLQGGDCYSTGAG